MDICDQADAQNEIAIAAALAKRQPEAPKPTGRCLNCNEKIPKTQRYCDGDCRADHEYREKMKRMGR